MKALFVIFAAMMFCVSLAAQWSQNAAFPTHIAGGDGEQVLPKTAVTAAGNVYVSRFDNAATGNYDVYLQRLNQQGVQQWAAGGVLVSNQPSMSWLTDYDMTADAAGNAIVCFQDIRNAGVNNVFVYKVDPSGAMQWGQNGIALSTDTSTDFANYSPKVYGAQDGYVYAAWQRSGTGNDVIRIHRLDPSGQKMWGEDGVSLTSTAGEYTWPQLLESANGDILVKYFIDSGPFWAPIRHMYVARYNTQGVQLWNTPITEAGGISAWNQIVSFESDGMGGAVLAWYDDRNSDMVNEVYVARVLGDGSLSTPAGGALVTSATGNQQYYPVITVDTAQLRIYVFFKITDADQITIGLCRQLLDFSGTRLWGETGVNMLNLSSYVASPVYSWQAGESVGVIYEEGAIPSSDTEMHLKASCYRSNGNSVFEAVVLATTSTMKYHFDCDKSPDSWVSLMWEDGNSAMDIYGMRVNGDGTIGMQYPAPRNLSATLIPPSTIILNWEAPQGSMTPSNYEIYMNDNLMQVVSGDLTLYQLEVAPGAVYTFYLLADYPENHQSAPSNTIEVIVVSAADELSPAVESSLGVYPNPVISQAEIMFYSKTASPAEFSIYNLKGQRVEQFRISAAKAGWNSFTWNPISKPASGIYFVRMDCGKDKVVKKIVVKW